MLLAIHKLPLSSLLYLPTQTILTPSFSFSSFFNLTCIFPHLNHFEFEPTFLYFHSLYLTLQFTPLYHLITYLYLYLTQSCYTHVCVCVCVCVCAYQEPQVLSKLRLIAGNSYPGCHFLAVLEIPCCQNLIFHHGEGVFL